MTNYKRALDHATLILGSEEAALDWIEKFSASLGAKPKDMIETQDGLNAVLLHLNNISRHRSE